MTKQYATAEDVWIRLTRSHHHILNRIEKALKSNNLPPLSWYDVLLELERAGPEGIRAFELRKKLLLPQYSLSRLISRIESEGYLEKLDCDEDGRGQVLVISPAGSEIRKKSWTVYNEILQSSIGDTLSDSEQKALVNLLSKLG